MTTDHNERGTTRLTAGDRRLAILDNAELVFVKNGFEATSTRGIAEACDVTEPVLYRHFKGKEDLYLSVLTRMLDDGLRELSSHAPSEDLARAARLRILEALLLCGTTTGMQQTTDLVRGNRLRLESAFSPDAVDGSGSELASELGKLILERIGIAGTT